MLCLSNIAQSSHPSHAKKLLCASPGWSAVLATSGAQAAGECTKAPIIFCVKDSCRCAGYILREKIYCFWQIFRKQKRIRPVIKVSKDYNLNRVVIKHMLFFLRIVLNHFNSVVWPLIGCLSSGRCPYIHVHIDNHTWTQWIIWERWGWRWRLDKIGGSEMGSENWIWSRYVVHMCKIVKEKKIFFFYLKVYLEEMYPATESKPRKSFCFSSSFVCCSHGKYKECCLCC